MAKLKKLNFKQTRKHLPKTIIEITGSKFAAAKAVKLLLQKLIYINNDKRGFLKS